MSRVISIVFILISGLSYAVDDLNQNSCNIIVKVKNATTIEKYLNEFNLTICKSLSKNIYLIKAKDGDSAIKISDKLDKREGIIYAHPDFVRKIIKR